MTYFHPAWIEAQRRRWTRCNAHLWRKPSIERPQRQPAARTAPPDPAEVQRLLADLRDLKQLVADIQLEFRIAAYLRHAAPARKYSPDQPRVPAGNPDGGQWTSDGGLSGLTHLAGDVPTGDSPSDLPKERPPTSSARTAALKAAARLLMRFGGPLAKVAQGALWLYQYDSDIKAYVDPPKTMQERRTPLTIRNRGTRFTTSWSRRRRSGTAIQDT